MSQIEVPVLVVGGGPVGLAAGLLFRRLGVDARIVERRTEPLNAPAAHLVNARTFEILRQAGADMAALQAVAASPADAGSVYWVTRLGGESIGRLPYERQGDDTLEFTPTPLRHLSQHRFTPILADSLRAAGAPTPLYGHRWESSVQDADGVTSRVTDLATGRRIEIRSRYLLAADGAGSPVRKSLGITPIGPDRIQSFVMIHFKANLRNLVGANPGALYWVCDPDCIGTFVAHDIDREWVFMVAWDPEREPAESFDAARCEALVRRAIARDDVALEIATVSTWAMTCQVAERYRDGRIFLVGDAAHRFPPTGGLGLNTGVQDVHNLAWKLAAVLAGSAGDRLLETFESERRPVAQYNAEQGLLNAVRLFEVPRALGFSDDPATARENFEATLRDPVRRRAAEEAIAAQAEHFDMLGLQLGYAYESGALVSDGSPRELPPNPVRELLPTSRPGSRLPHGWLGEAASQRSTLDLVALDRLTLLVGARGQAWLDAAAQLGTSLACTRIGVDVADPQDWWTHVARMGPEGALLVRPDQHVAYRSVGATADAPGALRAAVAAVLAA